jgi:hypothetical protein
MKRAHERPALASLGSAKYWPAFNLFRHKLKPDLVCAVPEDYPVPAFLDASTWAFAGKVSEPTTIPLGFKSKAAEAGVRFNGFYLFQASLIERDKITVEQKSEGPWGACAPPWISNLDPLLELAEPKGLGRAGT